MLAIYLFLVNIIALVLYGYDKHCAVTHRWRVSEKTLLTSAAIGGSLGAYLAMISFRHKTRHRVFQIFIPVLLVLQAIILLLIY